MSTLKVNIVQPFDGTDLFCDGNIGIGTDNITGAADPNNTTIVNAGIVTANFFYGDGSNLTGVSVLSTPQSTTSGTEFEFTDVPVWAKKITFMFLGTSLSGTDHYEIQLGTSSGYITTNYDSMTQDEGGNNAVNSTSSIIIRSGNATMNHYGQIIITKFSDSAYVWTGSFNPENNSGFQCYGGVFGISATVDRIKLFASGTNTFDAGQINVLYEG